MNTFKDEQEIADFLKRLSTLITDERLVGLSLKQDDEFGTEAYPMTLSLREEFALLKNELDYRLHPGENLEASNG